ncbi:ATP7B, partial [Symbiodinium natans]
MEDPIRVEAGSATCLAAVFWMKYALLVQCVFSGDHVSTCLPDFATKDSAKTCLDSLEIHASQKFATPLLNNVFEMVVLSSDDGSSFILGADKRAFVRWQQQTTTLEEMVQAVAHHLK